MLSLIMVVLSIALFAAFLLIGINYVRPWASGASTAYTYTTQGFQRLEIAFLVVAKAASGLAPAAIPANTDGGLAANFGGTLGFLPTAPPGYAWAYNRTSATAGWFCMYPTTTAAGSEATIRGMFRAKNKLSATQYFVTAGGPGACGSTINSAGPGGYPANYVATYFVTYSLGLLNVLTQ